MGRWRNKGEAVLTKNGDSSIDTVGLIFNIQRFSVHDGPGIRTLIFFKGCPLRCVWCDNPESQESYPQIAFYKTKCIYCGKCLNVCVEGAILDSEEGRKINRELCTNCGICAENCYAEALKFIGQYMTVEEVVEEVEKDRLFYRNSGGGVTLGGGEATMQPDFAMALLKECRGRGFHTAIETCGYVEWERFKNILEEVDLVLYDLKIMDFEKHRDFTAVSNEIILDNLKKVANEGIPIVIRVPVVPGCTDSEENIRAISKFTKHLTTVKEIELLPYHRLGESKNESLGRKVFVSKAQPPGEDTMRHLRKISKQHFTAHT